MTIIFKFFVPTYKMKLFIYQGWEFAHWFSERIARFLPKNERPERFAHNRSFPLSKLIESLIFGE